MPALRIATGVKNGNIRGLLNTAKHLLGVLFLCLVFGQIPLGAQATNEITVRFRLSYGSQFFGDIDVALFNDKPATVTNFLGYVSRGDYDNSFLHACFPGTTLQGGVLRVSNPFSPAPFQIVSAVPTQPAITNESRVGILRSNVFGTLAMTLSSTGGVNSARAAWFFNLGDNSNDTNSTVFGRAVLGRDNLRFFNTVSEGNGIQNLDGAFQRSFCAPALLPLNSLPVGFYGLDCLRYADLFNVQIFVLSNAPVRAPQITIKSPTGFTTISNTTITISGTAGDEEGVSLVRVYLNESTPVTATGTTNWSVTLSHVPPGTNVFVAEAVDSEGLRTQARRSFFRSALSPLTLLTNGQGTISGLTNGQMLEVGRTYQIIATPGPGHLFSSWQGLFVSESAKVKFLARSNTTITAVFATNLFSVVKGTYAGLFFDPEQVEQKSSGLLTLTLSDQGSYSARLSMNGQAFPFSGRFSADGRETNLISRAGDSPLLIRLGADFVDATNQMVGSISNLNASSSLRWSSPIRLDRPVFHANNPSPFAGRYTLLIPREGDFDDKPGGDSVGAFAVSEHGDVTFKGALADGTKLSYAAKLATDGVWPFYASLYGGKGAAFSLISITNGVESNVNGRFHWFKQSGTPGRFYTNGFATEMLLLGSMFTNALSPQSVLEFTSASLSFTNGNLLADFLNNVVLTNNRVLNLGSDVTLNRLSLRISGNSGLFSGTVQPPGSVRNAPFSGVVLQKQNYGAGFFLGTNQSGSLLFKGN